MELRAIVHNFYQKCMVLFVFTHRHQEGVLFSITDTNTIFFCKAGFVVLSQSHWWVIAVTGLTMSYRNPVGFCLLQKQDSLRMQNELGSPNYILKTQRTSSMRSLRDYVSLTSCRGHVLHLSNRPNIMTQKLVNSSKFDKEPWENLLLCWKLLF